MIVTAMQARVQWLTLRQRAPGFTRAVAEHVAPSLDASLDLLIDNYVALHRCLSGYAANQFVSRREVRSPAALPGVRTHRRVPRCVYTVSVRCSCTSHVAFRTTGPSSLCCADGGNNHATPPLARRQDTHVADRRARGTRRSGPCRTVQYRLPQEASRHHCGPQPADFAPRARERRAHGPQAAARAGCGCA